MKLHKLTAEEIHGIIKGEFDRVQAARDNGPPLKNKAENLTAHAAASGQMMALRTLLGLIYAAEHAKPTPEEELAIAS